MYQMLMDVIKKTLIKVQNTKQKIYFLLNLRFAILTNYSPFHRTSYLV